jgi:hypothetical protein
VARKSTELATTNLRENRSELRELSDDVLGEQRLHQDLQRLVLLGNTELVDLLVHLRWSSILPVLRSPCAQLTVRTILVLTLVVVVVQSHRTHGGLHRLSPGLDSLLGCVGGPVVELALYFEIGCLRLEPTAELVVAICAAVATRRAIIPSNRGCARHARRALSGVAGLALGLLRLLRRVLEDERRELVAHVDVRALAARLAVADDVLRLRDDEVRLRVLAALAEHELVDEDVEQLAHAGRIVGTIDDVPLGLVVECRLSAKLAAKELGGVGGGTGECAGHIRHVRDDCLDAVALSFDFRHEKRHAVHGHVSLNEATLKGKGELTGSGRTCRRHHDER